MSITVGDQYYLKALDAYGWDIDQSVESLNYALSYNPEDGRAYCLLARIYMEYFKDYKMAEKYFDESLVYALDYVDTYKYYTLLCIWTGQLVKAQKLIRFGLKVKGMDRSILYYRLAIIDEMSKKYESAFKNCQQAKLHSIHSKQRDYYKNEQNRLKKLRDKNRPKKKKKQKEVQRSNKNNKTVYRALLALLKTCLKLL